MNQPASVEQVAAFKLGAARRYAERGVAPAKADELFAAQVQKMAHAVQRAANPAVQALSQSLRAALA